ncbi:MDR family MFS transporter [Fictibacillus sp. Mic-4]|uniref:MDR family MFS transporter n=1 Tax=Fictibacillus sp. Mic-4 TaxID=3132826 RepID=UPI003CEA9114
MKGAFMEQAKPNTGFIIAGLLLAILVGAMDNTIVATAMPTIVKELGGFDKFVWVTSAYMIATVAGMPIFGKLSDMYGRKRFFLLGIILFMAGSILCGTAQSITQLSVYRAIQGLGGGALMPISFTIIFDIFPVEKRGKITGLFGAVFGISSIFGPLAGSYITDQIDWRWVFYINIPIGILSIILVSLNYKESKEHRKQQIDWGGAISLLIMLVSLMFALELGGKQYAWDSIVIIGLFVLSAVSLIIFLFVERKASDPIITFSLFKRRVFAASQGVAFLYGFVFISASVFIPIFIQGVFGGSATNSGLILMPMMLGSVVGSQLGGWGPSKFSFRNIMIVSGIFFISGVYLLSTMDTETARSMITLYMIILGFGVGFSFSLLNLASVNNVAFQQRGSATSMISTFRTIGMTLGVTIFGTIQSRVFNDKMADAFPHGGNMAHQAGAKAFSPEAAAKMPPQVLEAFRHALSDSIDAVFMWALIPAVLAFIFILLMGNERMPSRDPNREMKDKAV